MNPKAKGLGRGLDAIFEIENINVPAKKHRSNIDEIEISCIVPNPRQPRTIFDDEALGELAASIEKLGVIQPITVKKTDDDKYVIISGERRFRASQMAGLERVPVYIREADDETLLQMALVENIQREDLNAMEIALSLQRLVEECNLTQDSLAEQVGKKRSTVTNYIRLLKLPAKIQLAIKEELISMGHARALLGISDEKMQLLLLKKTLKNNLSVRQVEELVKQIGNPKAKSVLPDEEFPESYTQLVERLEEFFNQDISIKRGPKGNGKITIGFKSDAEISRFLSAFEKLTRN